MSSAAGTAGTRSSELERNVVVRVRSARVETVGESNR